MLKTIQDKDHQQLADALKRIDWKTLEEILHIFILMYFLHFTLNNYFLPHVFNNFKKNPYK